MMKTTRNFFKRIYLMLVWPLYRQLQHEMFVEIQRIIQCQLDSHGQLVQQFSDQFIKIHRSIDDLRNDQTNEKLDLVVAELTKIRESVDRLKPEQHGKEL
jgi:hypothetical protein